MADDHGARTALIVMPRLAFTPHLRRHLACPEGDYPGATVAEVLAAAFAVNPAARGYVLDEQGVVRHHMVVYVNGAQITDRRGLTDPVPPDGEVFVMQALSGG
jgi:sulfur-carrier protein